MTIRIRGAGENNLHHVNVDFGPGLTVVTGVSGSGKTSLVFDTLYHEARRRFLESFTAPSAGQRLAPARVESITGLGPAVAVGQNLLNRNPASTLATASGLHPFLRLLYARFGVRHCARCGAELSVATADEIVEHLVRLSAAGDWVVSAPLVRGVRGSHRTLLGWLESEFGPEKLRVDGQPRAGGSQTVLEPSQPHDIEVELTRLPGENALSEARATLQAAARLGAFAVVIRPADGADQTGQVLSRAPVCVQCGTWFSDLEPEHFHRPCPHCEGKGCERCTHTGLHPEAAGVRWQGLLFPELLRKSVEELHELFTQAELLESAARLRAEIQRRLEALLTVGLGYISLDRSSPTLSRGEAQRVRLAVALVSRLEDMLHVLDEPTVGQHPADVARLLPAFRQLAGPVICVEHDRLAAAAADEVVDMGPGAGSQGGRVVFSGTPAGLWAADTATGRFFSLRERLSPPEPRPPAEQFLTLGGVHLRNLREIDIPIPLSRLTVITGVSGSGKSTFVEDVLVESLKQGQPVGCSSLDGPRLKPVMVDQSPIGINPRSNPATYTGLADTIRDVFAAETGLSPSHFSFNRPEGACPTCAGMGAVEVKMRYLPSTWIPCSDCQGQRFSEEVLAAKVDFHGQLYSIADFFNLTVDEVHDLFALDQRLPRAKRQAAFQILTALRDVGLGYLPLGQPSPTLSGGEAQRVKLTRFLGKAARGSGRTRNGWAEQANGLENLLLVLDEPSTGLHPQDVAGLLVVLDRLVRGGATVVVVEHNLDIVRAADWVVDLGPGAGPRGGRLLYAGPPDELLEDPESITAQALRDEAQVQPLAEAIPVANRSAVISIREARANNLRNVSVDFPKGQLCVVTGVSGSGKSSLVSDVLEAEARRRFLESLSMYERQGLREGPEAPVGGVSGLGVVVRLGTERGVYDRRATVGAASELSHHLAVLLAFLGEQNCPNCGAALRREPTCWRCPHCGTLVPLAEPRHFRPFTYGAACRTCHGVGSLQVPAPHKLIIHPEKPVLDGAMYSPGFFPKGYLGKPLNAGYDLVMALSERYGFDPFRTPWNEMTPEAQHAFLFGDPEPMLVTFTTRIRTYTRESVYPGFYGFMSDWDKSGTYTDTQLCPECRGAGLRPEYASVRLGGQDVLRLNTMPLEELAGVLEGLRIDEEASSTYLAAASLAIARRRLRFLVKVGLGYLHLTRPTATLSAGEAQRIRLAGLLGSQLTSLTVLLDEPSRGLHPSEIEALLDTLRELCAEGNTVVVVEHEPLFMRAAGFLVDMGPGAGALGGEVVASGQLKDVLRSGSLTARWLNGQRRSSAPGRKRRTPRKWLRILGARGNNLRGDEIRFPLGALVGVCGVSGSGKSTLVIDTLGRALAPRKHTTSLAQEPVEPEPYDRIEGAPERVVLIDQTRAGVHSPADFLGLTPALIGLFAGSSEAHAAGITADRLARRCSACGGSGAQRLDMGFLPPVSTVCETCRGTGFLPEAWTVHLRGWTLPETFSKTIDEVYDFLHEDEALAASGLLRGLSAARDVGLGYLRLNQPGDTLSGGEAQRLKVAAELNLPERPRSNRKGLETLYILDEPTLGQHLEDVERLSGVLHRLVDAGHSVWVVEHHAHLLAACDWLIELGPGGGPRGGQVIAAGPPEAVAAGETPTAPYLRDVLEGKG